MKNKKLLITISISIFISIFFLSIGFSSFSSNLLVGDISAKVRVQKDIRISSNTVKSVSQDTVVFYNEYNVKNTEYGITLPYSDSYAIFDVGIKNLGNVEMGIKSITGLNNRLTYEIVNEDFLSEGYNSVTEREKLCDDKEPDRCKSGTETHVLVKIKYANTEAYNKSESKSFNINLLYDFKRVLKIEYGSAIIDKISTSLVEKIMENDDLQLGININNLSEVKINSTYLLIPNEDYLYNNGKLSINNIKDDLYIDWNSNYNYNSKVGIGILAEFESDRDVIITLNGSNNNGAFFIKVSPFDVEVTDNSSSFYDKKNVGTDAKIYKKGEKMYMSYEYISGDVTLAPFGKAFTIKYRDTTQSCAGINAVPELVINHTKNQFNILESGFSQGAITKDAVDFISIYADKGYVFDNFKFKIKYGSASDLETE